MTSTEAEAEFNWKLTSWTEKTQEIKILSKNFRCAHEVWQNVPVNVCANLIKSYQKLLEKVRTQKGFTVDYKLSRIVNLGDIFFYFVYNYSK